MIRFIGFDLDGTLLTPDKTVSEYTRKVLAECAQRNILLVPVTGRPLHGIPECVRSIPCLTHLICSNGAMTVDLKSGRILRRKAMSLELVREVLKRIHPDTIREIFIGGYGYIDPVTAELWKKKNLILAQKQYLRESRRVVDSFPAFLRRLEEEIVSVSGSEKKKAEDVFETESRSKASECFQQETYLGLRISRLKEFHITNEEFAESMYVSSKDETTQQAILGSVADLAGKCRMMESFSTAIEFGALQADKGRALLDLADACGIKRSETAAFGDGGNDIDFLKAAGTAVAMGNAIQKVKDCADFVTEDNEHDGVARGILRLL